MLQSLSLNNQKWISDKLTENIHAQENEQHISKEEILAGIDAGLKDLKAGGGMDAWEFLKELHSVHAADGDTYIYHKIMRR